MPRSARWFRITKSQPSAGAWSTRAILKRGARPPRATVVHPRRHLKTLKRFNGLVREVATRLRCGWLRELHDLKFQGLIDASRSRNVPSRPSKVAGLSLPGFCHAPASFRLDSRAPPAQPAPAAAWARSSHSIAELIEPAACAIRICAAPSITITARRCQPRPAQRHRLHQPRVPGLSYRWSPHAPRRGRGSATRVARRPACAMGTENPSSRIDKSFRRRRPHSTRCWAAPTWRAT